jgi:Lrp/AsnC family transcriptional regulator for asnA, asnC and gidA
VRLDDTDHSVLAALKADGRATAQSIAEALGIRPSTARLRLKKLLDAGVVRVLAIPDPTAVGSPLSYFVHFDIIGARDDALAAVAASVPNLDWVVLLDDNSRIALHATAVGLPHLAAAVDGIRRSRTSRGLLVEVVLRTHPGGSRSAGQGFSGEFDLDEVDRMLVRELETDGRRSYTALSVSTGLSVPATRERVLRLIESRAVQFDTILDHAAVGLNARAGLGVRVEGPVGDALSAILHAPSVTYAVEVAGSFDLRVELVCENPEGLAEAIATICALPGVEAVQAHPYSEEVLNNGMWL